MTYQGRVESVFLTLAGGVVSADASIGATSVDVDFPIDFDESGGSFTRVPLDESVTDNTVYKYTAVDVDAGTVTLDTSASTVSNFLTGDNASFAASKGTWATIAGSTPWVSGLSEDGDNGALQLTSSAGGSAPTAGSVSNANYALALPCVSGDTIYVSGWFMSAAVARTAVVGCVFFKSDGTVIGGGATFGTGVTTNTTGWVQATATLTAPALTAYARAQVQVQGTGATETHYFDNAWMSKGVPGSGLAVAFSAGDMLYVEPQSSEARALVRMSDSEDEAAVDCRVSHAIRPLLKTGARDPGTGETVLVDEGSEGLVVTDVVGQDPVITGARFVATGDSGELLTYAGEPEDGNLQTSLSAVDGVDEVGNYYLAGIVSYSFDTDNSLYVATQVNSGTVVFYTATTMQAVGGTGSPWGEGPKIDGWSVQTGMLAVSGPVAFTDPFQVLDPVAGTLETWHSLGNLGQTGITMSLNRYRLTPDGEVEFDFVGSCTQSGGLTAAGKIFPNALPSVYRPSVSREYPVGCGPTSTGRILIDSSTGNVTFSWPDMNNLNVIGTGFHMPRT